MPRPRLQRQGHLAGPGLPGRFRRLTLRGEGHFGSNLTPFGGGILQGVIAIAANPLLTEIRPVGDQGGWAEFSIPATVNYKNAFYVGEGADDPPDADLRRATGCRGLRRSVGAESVFENRRS